MNLYKLTQEQVKELGFEHKQGNYHNYELNYYIRGYSQQTQFKGYFTFTLLDYNIDSRTGEQIIFDKDIYKLEEFIKSSLEIFQEVYELDEEENATDTLIDETTIKLPGDLAIKSALKREDVVRFREKVLSMLEKYKV